MYYMLDINILLHARARTNQHGEGRLLDIHGELIRVPTEKSVAGVGVDAAQKSELGGHQDVVLVVVAGQGGVVGFDVELEVVGEAVRVQETNGRLRVCSERVSG